VNLLRILAVALLFCLSAPAGAQQAGQPGRFDFYVLALSWSPSFCEASGERKQGRADQQCRSGRPFAFVVHGLWPQYEHGFPTECVKPAPWLPDALIRSMLDLMPAHGLVIHEWRTHGTCSGLEPQHYFDVVRGARERLVIPQRFHRLDDYTMVSPAEVEDAFIAANPGLRSDMIAVTCDQRRLHEVRVCMTRDFEFRSCPEIDRRACRVPRIVMPPVRGG
jgi:ribonuclease T2